MRIVGGRWAGRALASPSGRVRPTAERVRVACMDRVASALPGARVLDLFAGTGALGLEALSRGAQTCDFVENGRSAVHALKANVAALRVRGRVRIFDRDVIPFVERLEPDSYDLTFADPPYHSRKLDRVLERWLLQPFSGMLVVEHAPDHAMPAGGSTRQIDDSAITLFDARHAPRASGRGREVSAEPKP